MAVKLLNLTKRVKVQLPSDPDFGSDAATTFELGAVDSRIMGMLKDKAISLPVSAFDGASDATASMNLNQVNFDIVRHGIKSWTNFLHPETGAQVIFKAEEEVVGRTTYQVAPSEFVSMIDPDDLQYLADKITNANTFSEAERKN